MSGGASVWEPGSRPQNSGMQVQARCRARHIVSSLREVHLNNRAPVLTSQDWLLKHIPFDAILNHGLTKKYPAITLQNIA